ncbi:MAG: hypothetical protein EBR69_05190 [Synechococcaceae bacterium WB4_2_0805]|nr:hypothetical protein [Synechococcaceae bacterium WB4_2_0805]
MEHPPTLVCGVLQRSRKQATFIEAGLTGDDQINGHQYTAQGPLQPQHLAVAAFYLRFHPQKVEIVGGREVPVGGRSERDQPQWRSRIYKPAYYFVNFIGRYSPWVAGTTGGEIRADLVHGTKS